ncbi:Ycf49-like protein [Vitis vinifera]|uniref:Ycf49-like protein n=1 Tax=Vitis vinifera TaxID=29760 RepID=A0A438K269_VITVI|nr:Ycf49-like protein [Vitis vinifera]
MSTATLLCYPRILSPSPSLVRTSPSLRTQSMKPPMSPILLNQKVMASLFGAGLALTLVGPASAAELPLLTTPLQFSEPANALSLPTWAIHVSSVVEWIIAMILVWKYGEQPGFESWKGLSWGMVPLLGGAFCACTWHFFYNSESLEVRKFLCFEGAFG